MLMMLPSQKQGFLGEWRRNIFWNFCGGQATLYYFHLVWESMPFYSALVRLTPGGLECESSSPASSSLGASSPFVMHKNKRSRSEYPSPAGSSLGASLTIEEEEYLRKKRKLADVQLGKETVLSNQLFLWSFSLSQR